MRFQIQSADSVLHIYIKSLVQCPHFRQEIPGIPIPHLFRQYEDLPVKHIFRLGSSNPFLFLRHLKIPSKKYILWSVCIFSVYITPVGEQYGSSGCPRIQKFLLIEFRPFSHHLTAFSGYAALNNVQIIQFHHCFIIPIFNMNMGRGDTHCQSNTFWWKFHRILKFQAFQFSLNRCLLKWNSCPFLQRQSDL